LYRKTLKVVLTWIVLGIGFMDAAILPHGGARCEGKFRGKFRAFTNAERPEI
jgi:hypothetical protein